MPQSAVPRPRFSIRCALVLFTSFVIVGFAPAGAYTALDLMHQCAAAVPDDTGLNADTLPAAACLAYIQGIVDTNGLVTLFSGKKSALFCPPESGITTEQAVRVILKYIKENPDNLNNIAHGSAVMALSLAFPCHP